MPESWRDARRNKVELRRISYLMRRQKRGWTEQECEKLKALVNAGASPFRAAGALHRSVNSVKSKARELGCPFQLLRSVKAKVRELLGN